MSAGRLAAYVIMIGATLLWITPILWALFTALRPYAETAKYGYLSWPRHLTFANFSAAWTGGDMVHYFKNSVIITDPVGDHLPVPGLLRRVRRSAGSATGSPSRCSCCSSPATCCRRRC